MVFAGLFTSLASLILITETAKITAKTIRSTADQARNPQTKINLGQKPTGLNLGLKQNSFSSVGSRSSGVKPININVQGILKDLKTRKGLI